MLLGKDVKIDNTRHEKTEKERIAWGCWLADCGIVFKLSDPKRDCFVRFPVCDLAGIRPGGLVFLGQCDWDDRLPVFHEPSGFPLWPVPDPGGQCPRVFRECLSDFACPKQLAADHSWSAFGSGDGVGGANHQYFFDQEHAIGAQQNCQCDLLCLNG